MAIMNSF